MSKKELEKRINELEKRINELKEMLYDMELDEKLMRRMLCDLELDALYKNSKEGDK